METEAKLKPIEDTSLVIRDFAHAFTINNITDLDLAQNELSTIKELKIKIAEFFDSDIEKAFSLHRSLTSKRKRFLDPVEEAERIIKRKIGDFADAERKRIADEARKREEAARKEEEKEQERLLNQAAKAEEKGNTDIADNLVEQATRVHVPRPVVRSAVAESGISTKTDWEAQVIDKKLVPDEYKIVDLKLLTSLAKARKGQIEVPGIKFVEKTVVINR